MCCVFWFAALLNYIVFQNMLEIFKNLFSKRIVLCRVGHPLGFGIRMLHSGEHRLCSAVR